MGIIMRKTCIISVFLALVLALTACDELLDLVGGSASVTGVSLKASVSLAVGESETLSATITPSNAADKSVTWKSSNAAVATVSDGVVTGNSVGTATITVTTVDGGKTANCAVTVNTGTSASVRKVSFSGPTETVTLSGLSNKSIYLVKVNTSASTVSAANTGSASGSSVSVVSGNVLPAPDDTPKVRMGHPAADEFNANPPPFERKPLQRSDSSLASSVVYSVGATKQFWVETTLNSNKWEQKTATLRKQGTYGNIWVVNDLTTFTPTQAQAMADKFDLIYPIETSLLGYEFGGGPGGDGGRDGDTRIQILVYDIGYNPSGTTLGYFWAKDYYDQATLDYNKLSYKTNLAEIFYLNGRAEVITNLADQLYSTLVHEFQHMINFNVKSVKNGKNSDSWYNEMLSMLAEDVISPLIGIGPSNSGHPIKSRIPRFLTNYNLSGITEWGPTDNQLDSYSTAYAFGAYLLRNYGGASLLQEMLANNSTNIASVTAALRTVNANSGLSFEEAVRRYGEALTFSGTMPSDVQSFDRTVTKTIGSYTYTATKFNIWSDFGATTLKVFGVNEKVTMRPYSLTVHQAASGWTNQSGTKTITLQRPNDSSIEFYLMMK